VACPLDLAIQNLWPKASSTLQKLQQS